jgi:cell division protein FtsB
MRAAERLPRPGRWVAVLVPVVALGLASAMLAADGENGFLRLRELGGRVDEARARLDDLESERARLVETIRGLRDDPVFLEEAARERLGWVRPGDIVIRWETRTPASD